jgi:hypothetical protein
MVTRYQPSGKIGPLSFLAPIAPIPAAIVAAWIYQFLIEVIPLVYAEVLIVAAFAVVLGLMTFFSIRLTRCRNAAAALITGGVIAVTALLASHYFAYLHHHTVIAKALGQPLPGSLPIGKYLEYRMNTGWSFGSLGGSNGLPLTGAFVLIFWALEAAALIAGGLIGGSGAASTPYCEPCQQWADLRVAEARVVHPAPDSLLRVRNPTTIVDLLDVPVAGSAPEELIYTLWCCPACRKFHTLSVLHKQTVNDGKKQSTRTHSLHSYVLLTEAEADAVRDMAGGPPAAAAAA